MRQRNHTDYKAAGTRFDSVELAIEERQILPVS
jgi:hypothetical protein